MGGKRLTIVVAPGLAAYGKVAPWVIAELRRRGLEFEFDKALRGGLVGQFIGDPVKRGDKFLQKHGLPPIQEMDPKRDSKIAKLGKLGEPGWLFMQIPGSAKVEIEP